MKCVHCCRNKVVRPRGLCWTCYYTDGVRALYGIRRRTGLWANVNPNRPASRPTTAPPGSPEKLAVIAARAKAGETLWHPEDVL